ncbi:dienelactone hydrolase [Leptospira fluminis]|uniref:Dienelactone hydrolase n=1 Tax=Leptospira fluminis TaxID=2484979 RepID=A0A4R9GRH0_9LEPT|nr:dienelactone hydrolase [Leptospira fluminis]
MDVKTKVESSQLTIPVHLVSISARLDLPVGAKKLVLLVEGVSERLGNLANVHFSKLCEKLHSRNIATLQVESLLTIQERSISFNRVDTILLRDRLFSVVAWLRAQNKTKNFRLFCCASYDAVAYVVKAVLEKKMDLDGIISVSGNPDGLDGDGSIRLAMPVLLIYGGFDVRRIKKMEKSLLRPVRNERDLEIVQLSSGSFTEEKKWEQAMDKIQLWLDHIDP